MTFVYFQKKALERMGRQHEKGKFKFQQYIEDRVLKIKCLFNEKFISMKMSAVRTGN